MSRISATGNVDRPLTEVAKLSGSNDPTFRLSADGPLLIDGTLTAEDNGSGIFVESRIQINGVTSGYDFTNARGQGTTGASSLQMTEVESQSTDNVQFHLLPSDGKILFRGPVASSYLASSAAVVGVMNNVSFPITSISLFGSSYNLGADLTVFEL